MFYVENNAQPKKLENIGQSLWWSAATLSTVGYGDICPITPLGKLLSSVIALIGIGVLALPTGIINSAFINRLEKHKVKECECPKWGPKF